MPSPPASLSVGEGGRSTAANTRARAHIKVSWKRRASQKPVVYSEVPLLLAFGGKAETDWCALARKKVVCATLLPIKYPFLWHPCAHPYWLQKYVCSREGGREREMLSVKSVIYIRHCGHRLQSVGKGKEGKSYFFKTSF